MKYLKLLILSIFIISCSNKKELKGYWYGEFENTNNTVLLKFEGYTYIDFTSIYQDTIKYNYFRNNIYSEENGYGVKRNFKYKIENKQLSIFDITNDSLIIKLRRPIRKNIVLEHLKDSTMKINLPEAKGFENFYGYEFELNKTFYLTYKNKNLVANFLGSTRNVDSTYHNFLQEYRKKTDMNFSHDRWGKISLIADKNIKISDFRKVISQLQMGNINRAEFCLNTDNMNYEDLNIFSLRLPQMDEKEYAVFEKYNMGNLGILPPPIFFTEERLVENENRIMLIEVSDKEIKLNEKVISKSDLKERLVDAIEEKHEINIFYYLDEDMTYQDYVDFNLLFIKSIYSVRADYLMKKYDIKYVGGKSDLGKRKEIREAKLKYPMVFHLLDTSELQLSKKVLFNN